MIEIYKYEVIVSFTQSQKGDYHFIRFNFPENDDCQVVVKISNPRKMLWEQDCSNMDWERCLCYIAITEGLKKQKKDIFLKDGVSPGDCPWPDVQKCFKDNVCVIESPDSPFGFHSKK